ncbi:MAG: UDP-N-acetylmuramoyl-L-alanine--D-glutamate ligase [Clostridia bacterium]|nr:UDP-N-acetylmuramoyl-L-alanine--D-glutamate ligase [Clostridia bacterium]
MVENAIVREKGAFLKDKRVLVVGLARSGIAAAKLCAEVGAFVTVNDLRGKDALEKALSELDGCPVRLSLENDGADEARRQDYVIISPGVPLTAPSVLAAKAAGVPVLGELELAARLCPAEYVAVTGTNGKTTTVTLLGEIFSAAGKRSHVCGNVGYPMCQTVMECAKDDAVVVEVSSFQLETTSAFHPRAAAVLNVTEDHLNRHGTMDVYIGLKRHIFDAMDENDAAVLNGADPIVRAMAEGLRVPTMLFSSKQEEAQGVFVRGGRMIVRFRGVETDICAADEIRIPGTHNLENAMAASAIAIARGVDASVIRETLRTFAGVEHRIEFVREKDGVRYINDSKGTNCDSTEKAIDAMKAPTALILGGYDKHVSFDRLAEKIAGDPHIRLCVLIGATADQIEKSLLKAGVESILRAQSLEEAVQLCKAKAAPGWNALLSPACASFDMFSDFEERGRVFKQIVRAL